MSLNKGLLILLLLRLSLPLAALSAPLLAVPDGWKIWQQGFPDHFPVIRLDSAEAVGGKDWLGPADLSADVQLAWSDGGLFFLFTVRDQEVINELPPDQIWKKDGVELVFRPVEPEDHFMIHGKEVPRLQILFSAPDAQGLSKCFVYGRQQPRNPLVGAGQRLENGYQLKIFVPKTLFGDMPWNERTRLNIGLAINDYDHRDGSRSQPRFLSAGKIYGMNRASEWKFAFRFCRNWPEDGELSLAPYWQIHIAQTPYNPHIRIRQPGLLQYDAVEVELKSARKELLLHSSYQNARDIRLRIPEQAPPGQLEIFLTAFKDGKKQGVVQRRVMQIATVLRKLENLDWPRLLESDPWRASGYLGLYSACEFFRYALQVRQPELSRQAIEEIQARLAVLEKRPLPPDYQQTPLRLLELTRSFEGQIAVEFSRQGRDSLATVTALCGSFPLVSAEVRTFVSAEKAQNYFDRRQLFFHHRTRPELVRSDQTVCGRTHLFAVSLLGDLIPGRQVTLYNRLEPELATRYPFPAAAELAIDAVVILGSTPSELRTKTRKWAQSRKIPEITLERRHEYDLVMIAGIPPHETFSAARYSRYSVEAEILMMRQGNLVFTTSCNNRELGMSFARLLLEGKPLTRQHHERLRFFRAGRFPELPATDDLRLAARELYVGDVHTHTMRSDGSATPNGLTAEAVYAGLDFLVISDHDLLEGGLEARGSAATAQLLFPVFPGQELTDNGRFHLNIYPLETLIDKRQPVAAILRAADSQGAVVQLNHPMSFGRRLEKYWYGSFLDSGVKVVERNLEHYAAWQEQATMPAIVGSTDTHHGIFGFFDSTVIRTRNMNESGLSEAIRSGQCAMICSWLPDYVYGHPDLRAAVIFALQHPEITQAISRRRLARTLAQFDPIDFFVSGRNPKPGK